MKQHSDSMVTLPKPRAATWAASAFCALLLALCAALLPGRALASQIDTPSDFEGTVYITYSHDGIFSTGNIDNGYMVMVPVDLATLAEVSEPSGYDADDDGIQELTVIQLWRYVMDEYGMGSDSLMVQGEGTGHAYLYSGAWYSEDGKPWDENLNYYYNGMYPLKYEGIGATCDQLTLHDGDFIDVMHFTSWSFWTDPASGFQFFGTQTFVDAGYSAMANIDRDAKDLVAHEFETRVGEPLQVPVMKSSAQMRAGSAEGDYTTSLEGYYDSEVFYGTELYEELGSVPVGDDDGAPLAEITFDEPGVYWIWTEGQVGEVYDDVVVNAPAVALVFVDEADPAPVLEDLVVENGPQARWVAGKPANISARVANLVEGETVDSWTWEYSKDGKAWKKTGAKQTASGAECSLAIPECTVARKAPMAWRATATTSLGRVATTAGQSLFEPAELTAKATGKFAWVAGKPVDISIAVGNLGPGESVATYQWYYSKDGKIWKKTGAVATCSGNVLTLAIPECTPARKAPMAWRVTVTTTDGRAVTSPGVSLVG